jgi:hypothetical protein
MYFHSDGNGDVDLTHPMTHSEHVQHYWEVVDDDPTLLADIYLNFHDFSRIEFLFFKDRLSAAILVARSAMRASTHLGVQLQQDQQDGSRRVPDWETESDDALANALDVVHNAQGIATGAAMLTAVAALELLLSELSENPRRRDGFNKMLIDLLSKLDVSPDDKGRIMAMAAIVGKRRNSFAHRLTGSYWDETRLEEVLFTPKEMDDTLYKVAAIAIAMEGLVG